MVRSTRILHKQREYLIQDEGASSASRTITFLGRPESFTVRSETSEHGEYQPILTDHGQWIPIAKWSGGQLALLPPANPKLKGDIESILRKYLHDGPRDSDGKAHKVYYYLEKEGRLFFRIVHSHPNGLAIRIFESKKQAERALGGKQDSGSDVKVRQTSTLHRLLVKAADMGYAGAVLNDEEPLYFCLDANDEMVVLRVAMDDDEEVEEYLLQENGTWKLYEGDRDIELFLDQDRCDQNMVRHLGDIPFIGHQDMDHAWTIEYRENRGVPYVSGDDDTLTQGVPESKSVFLFKNCEGTMEFIREKGLFSCEAARVENIGRFLKQALEENLCVLLEPQGHRASGGTLWINGRQIVLDSFSGFWIMQTPWNFTKAFA